MRITDETLDKAIAQIENHKGAGLVLPQEYCTKLEYALDLRDARAEIARLREALEQIAGDMDDPAAKIARAVLEVE